MTRQIRLLAVLARAVAALAGCGGSDSATGAATGTTAAGPPGASAVLAELDGIAQRGNVLGDAKAPWTLVEYGDLQCPACKYFADTTLPPVIERFVKTGKLRLELRPFGYVGPDSLPAAAYAWAAARQDRLHSFTRLWYANQGQENSGYVTDAFARKIARGVPGLDAERVVSDAKAVPVRAKVQQTGDDFRRRGLEGTPSFLIGRTGSGTLRDLDLGQGSGEEAIAAIEAATAG